MHALPVLAAVRRAWPLAHVAWLIGSGFQSLLAGHSMIDELIPFDRRHFARVWYSPRVMADFYRFARDLRRRRFELVLDLQGLVRSGLFAWLTGARRRLGPADAREFAWIFYTQRVRWPADAHAVDKLLAVLPAIGISTARADFPLEVRDSERAAAGKALATQTQEAVPEYIVLLPGARWGSKRWPVAHTVELLRRLHAAGAPRCVLAGAPDERALAAAITAEAPSRWLIDLVGRTDLRVLTALIAGARLVISQDSGPMHIAAALGVPTVSLFGPTNPRRTGPYSPAAEVLQHRLPCMPCYRRTCPLGHHDCMGKLTPDVVARAVLARLSQ